MMEKLQNEKYEEALYFALYAALKESSMGEISTNAVLEMQQFQ